MKKLRYHYQNIKSSFWFVPLLIILTGIGLAVGFLYVDISHHYKPTGILRFIFSGSANSARSVLSSIAAAMIGVAGTVFSITLVVLTLASSQFGPRLLRNFMYNRLNQTVLGVYVSTFLFCLIILNAVKGSEEFTLVPNLSILFAIVMTVVNIVLLILFIHHVSLSIQPSYIIAEIGRELEKSIQQFLVNKSSGAGEDSANAIFEIKNKLKVRTQVKSPKSGYLQLIDIAGLIDFAENENCFIEIRFKPGEYVVKNVTLVEVSSEGELEKSKIRFIENYFVLASQKTIYQDPEFAIHQIVEIAVKALSPGINDPYTAINCIDSLSASICRLTEIKFPSKFHTDQHNIVRISTIPLTFEGMLNTAFNQIRQFGAGSPSVIIRLMEALRTVHEFSKTKKQEQAILRHAKMVFTTGENSFQDSHDIADLQNRYNSFNIPSNSTL